jgi:hypothetical protein
MFSLYLALAGLGLAAIDPIGIGIMPVLLVQRDPYKRALIFLSGSFVSLVVMGLAFAKGLGRVVLTFEHHNRWFVPSIELIGGATLLIVSLTVFWQLKQGKTAVEPAGKTRQWLSLGNSRLFVLGALLVAIQSVLDVVFVIAMVRIGQLQLSYLGLITAIITYSIMAIMLQLAVIAAFYLAPSKQKTAILEKVHQLLLKYSYQALGLLSLVLSATLFVLAA